MPLDSASEIKLNQVVAYLNEKSNNKLWARLYQKIIFLLELEHFKKYQKLSIGITFQSYLYGPFSKSIAQALENPNKIDIPKYVKDEVDDILVQYGLSKFDNKSQEKFFEKIINYIHSLKIYNMTPFEADFDFSLYNFEDLFKTMDSNLDGLTLQQEKYKNTKIEIKSQEYEHLF
ncbi:type II toxin-antitoxin system antitoxin SocA domain-containing protein [Helicobacter sp. MIT 05-5294]|uniref:type II toxin-antitoxin system antitoxin SocA domain-containing protein n=1 Tax=Helicobacter sp. MIT 05-5294 TaxID=1548150 RepID=UPI00051FEE3E|nr:type II toxin-antitoxin system antitoxin SocA domain-containing protein [Helicobacter sp. MIT 05-5294]TLD85844.1 DUF4065 domain-containing protein [Helicobacter sp. MIT 05-5294]